jgi:hypothetical protein
MCELGSWTRKTWFSPRQNTSKFGAFQMDFYMLMCFCFKSLAEEGFSLSGFLPA